MNLDRDIRPDPDMEGAVGSWLIDTDLPSDETEAGLHRLLETFPATPQTRRRFLGRWLDHPAATDIRRTRLMFSATALTAAIAVLAIGANVYLPQPVPPNTVALTGSSGTSYHATIAEAVTAAEDGDTIRIGPGVYEEAVVIDRDITLRGDGAPSEVIMRAPDDGPVTSGDAAEGLPYGIWLRDSDAVVSALTMEGRRSAVVAFGGSPTIEGLSFHDVGWPHDGRGDQLDSVTLIDTSGIVRDSTFVGGGGIDGSETEALIEHNILTDGPNISGYFGEGTIIRGNKISNPELQAITIWDGGQASILDNELSGVPQVAIMLGWTDGSSLSSTVVGNSVDGALVGIEVAPGAHPEIAGNTITGANIAMMIHDSDGAISDNQLVGNPMGVAILAGSPSLTDNNVVDGLTGLSIAGAATPILTGNTICGSQNSILLQPSAAMPETVGNDICQVLASN